MPDVFICDAIGTPIGRYGDALSAVRSDDFAALPIKALMQGNASVNWSKIDVLYGCVNRAGEDNRDVARIAVRLSGLSDGVAEGCVIP